MYFIKWKKCNHQCWIPTGEKSFNTVYLRKIKKINLWQLGDVIIIEGNL